MKPNNHEKMKHQAGLILRLNRAIRHVAIVDHSNTVIESMGRETFSLPLTPETMIDFASIGPLLVVGAFGHKLESSCGRIGYVVGRFEKALVAIYQLRRHMIIIVFGSVVETKQLEEIATQLKRMADSSL